MSGLNRLQQRAEVASEWGVSIPDGGILTMCQYVYTFRSGASDDIFTTEGYEKVLRKVVETWDYFNMTPFDRMVLDMVNFVLGM